MDKLAQINMNKYVQKPLISKKITALSFDPTQMIFVGFERGDLIALTLDAKKYHYNYFEIPNEANGDRIYCTAVQLMDQKNKRNSLSQVGSSFDEHLGSGEFLDGEVPLEK